MIRSNNAKVPIHATMAILAIYFANAYASGLIQPAYHRSQCQIISIYKLLDVDPTAILSALSLAKGVAQALFFILFTCTSTSTSRNESHLLSLSQYLVHDAAHSFGEDQDEKNHTPTSINNKDTTPVHKHANKIDEGNDNDNNIDIDNDNDNDNGNNKSGGDVPLPHNDSSSNNNLRNVQSHYGNCMDPDKAL